MLPLLTLGCSPSRLRIRKRNFKITSNHYFSYLRPEINVFKSLMLSTKTPETDKRQSWGCFQWGWLQPVTCSVNRFTGTWPCLSVEDHGLRLFLQYSRNRDAVWPRKLEYLYSGPLKRIYAALQSNMGKGYTIYTVSWVRLPGFKCVYHLVAVDIIKQEGR